MNKKIEDALKKLVGDDAELFDALSQKLDSVNRQADGMVSRDAADPAPAPATETPAQRAITEEDVTALVGSDLFKNAVREIVTSVMDEQQQANEEKAKEVPAPVADVVAKQNSVDDGLMKAISDLQASVSELSKSREAEVQEVLNDLPARISSKTIIRPRATRMPGAPGTGRSNKSLAEVAAQTLALMGVDAG